MKIFLGEPWRTPLDSSSSETIARGLCRHCTRTGYFRVDCSRDLVFSAIVGIWIRLEGKGKPFVSVLRPRSVHALLDYRTVGAFVSSKIN